jgi:osmotically-inducible protein OsmY
MDARARIAIPALLATLGAWAPAMAPALEASTGSAIIVEEQRSSMDQHLQSLVMEALAADAHLTGRISVESRDAVVTLGGWTLTVGQARRAEYVARHVDGVVRVDNQIRPQTGGSL